MPLLINRLVFIKMRRLFELLILIFFLIIVLTICSKWSSSSSIINDNHKYLNIKINPIPVNPFLPQDPFLNLNDNNNNNNRMTKTRIDLAKYIHLDLKGAPPQTNKFYENFFYFI